MIIDLNTGNTLSKVLGEGMGSNFAFFADEMDYDAETNSYILVSANNEVLFLSFPKDNTVVFCLETELIAPR